MNLRIVGSASVHHEALGPFRTYLLTRGLILLLNSEGAIVRDSVGSSVSFPLDCKPDEFGFYASKLYMLLLRRVERELGVRLVGFHGGSADKIAFKVDEHLISGGSLAEALLSRLLTLEDLVRKRVQRTTGISQATLMEGLNVSAALEDEIYYGRMSPASLEQAIESTKKIGVPVEQAFFVTNSISIAEDMRHALMAACFHFRSLNSRIRTINQTRPPPPFWGGRLISLGKYGIPRKKLMSSRIPIQAPWLLVTRLWTCCISSLSI